MIETFFSVNIYHHFPEPVIGIDHSRLPAQAILPTPADPLLSSKHRKPRGRLREGNRRRGDISLRPSRSSDDAKKLRPSVIFTGDKRVIVWVLLIFIIHSLGLALLFDPVSGLLNDQPVIEQDWGLHFHHLKSMEGFWQSNGRLWGYNPFFMAGYPSNTIQDLSIKLFEILSLLLSGLGLNPIQAFKLLVFIAMAAVPWIMFFTARNFFQGESFTEVASLVAAFLSTAYWWNSLPREMFFYGMLGFPSSSYFSLLTLSLFYRFLKSEKSFSLIHVGWVLAAILVLPLHLQTVLIVVLPALALLVVGWKTLRVRVLLWLGAGIVGSILVNLIWLCPVFTHQADDVSSTMVAQLPLFSSADPLTFLKDYLRPAGYWTFRASYWENGLRWMLLIVGWTGVVKLVRSERRDVGITMVCAVLTLFLLTYFGSLIPFVKGWQPLRFKVPYDLFLVLTSSYLVGAWKYSGLSNLKPILIPTALLCSAITFSVNLIQSESKNNMRLRTQVLPEVKEIVEWIRNEAPINGRVLFEESGDETGFLYDGMYLSSFIPHATGHQLVGGPINLYNDRHHFAEFHSGILFKRDIMTFGDEELRHYFQTYNIGAIVTFHPQSVQRLLSVPQLVSLDRRLGDLHLMKVNQPLNWFLKGEGNVEAGLNRIRCSNVEGDEVVLKYHWTEGLAVNPPAKIEPQKILDDPIPFIKIIDPPAEFTLAISE